MSESKSRCEYCHGIGRYGDNGPGLRGNAEYRPCDMCSAPRIETERMVQDAAPDLLNLVLDVEWVNGVCPYCLGHDWKGHAADCPRQAALRKAGMIE